MKRYCRVRRAYFPRIWPPMVASSLIVFALLELLRPRPTWLVVVIGLGIGLVIAQVRWALWRWQHPRVSHDQWVSDWRRAAPWN